MVRMHSSANYSFDMQKAHISAEEEMELVLSTEEEAGQLFSTDRRKSALLLGFCHFLLEITLTFFTGDLVFDLIICRIVLNVISHTYTATFRNIYN